MIHWKCVLCTYVRNCRFSYWESGNYISQDSVCVFIDVVVILYNSGCVNICVSGDVIVTQKLSCVCDINQSISAL